MTAPGSAPRAASVRVPIFLPCGAGVEPLLLEETLRLLPSARAEARRGGVALQGGIADVMALNLESRLAQRVLVEVAEGPYRDEQDLYALARSVDASAWIEAEQTIRVDVTAQRSPLRSLRFAGLRIKDGICDRFRDQHGARPSVDTSAPDLPVVLHVGPERAQVYFDSSGEPLFKRGWREDVGEAPLKETLAAAMLAAAGWQGDARHGGALLDPCCGSGTIAIEAAQIAMHIAPGAKRRFAFERWRPHRTPAALRDWARLREAARQRVRPSPVPISASDIAFRMVDFARRNAERAGVSDAIDFHGGDALERPAPRLPSELPGTILLNPPYGERIDARGRAASGGRDAASDTFFTELASHWKKAYTSHAAGWTAWILSPDARLPGVMRLKESRRVPLWNGPIECRLFRFDLVAGSARKPRSG